MPMLRGHWGLAMRALDGHGAGRPWSREWRRRVRTRGGREEGEDTEATMAELRPCAVTSTSDRFRRLPRTGAALDAGGAFGFGLQVGEFARRH